MCKKTLFAGTILLFLLILIGVPTAFADASAQLKQAEQLFKEGQYQQAEAVYQQILIDYPATDAAFTAQKQFAFLYIAWNRYPQAETAYNQLIANFSGHKDIAQAVHDIAYRYRCVNKHEKANELDQYVVAIWPDSDYAVLGQMDIAKYYVDQGDENNAEAAIIKLLNNYPGHELTARAVHDVAQHYRYTKKYEKANELYQFVVKTWPKAEYALWAQADLIKSYLALGDDSSAEAAVEKLLTNFNDNPLIARAIWDTGQHYRDLKKYEKANQLYKHVVETWPKAEHAIWAQADLIKSYLAQGDDTAAEAAAKKLLTNFNDNPLIARAIWDTGQYYRDLKKYEEANQLYKHVVENWPKAEHAIWAQADLIKSYLALGDGSNAESAVEKLIADFSWSEHIARAIHDTAWEYRKLANYSRANELDQYVIDHWPQDVQAMWAKMDMAKTDIALGDYAAADKTVDILIADFNDLSEMPTAIFILGEQYYNKAFTYENQRQTDEAKSHFQKAIAIWQRIINELPQSSTTPQAYYFAARCYDKLEQHAKALEYYQVVVDTWPEYEFAWNAQFMIACCLEQLTRGGQILLAEGARQIQQACQNVLNYYPESKAAPPAGSMLRSWQSVKAE